MREAKAHKKTSFVPRIIFQAASATALSVVPLCALACGGTVLVPGGGSGEAGADIGVEGVACQAFDGPCGVARVAFDSGPDVELGVSICAFDGEVCGVAACGFEGGPPCGVADASFGVADVGFADGPLGVAMKAFDASSDSR